MKPIEPGCLALYHADGEPSDTVTVVEQYALTNACRCRDCGRIGYAWVCAGFSDGAEVSCECHLTRIDGHEEPTTTEQAETA